MSAAAVMGLCAGIVISTLTGLMIVQAAQGMRRRPDVLTSCFSASTGFAVHSAGYLLWTLALRDVPGGWLLIDLALLAASGGAWWYMTAPSSTEPLPQARGGTGWIGVACVIGFAVSLWMAALAMLGHVARAPLGDWDAWAMWNFKARMLYLAPDHVRALFAAPFPHPDYPLLLPLTIARLWRYAGAQTLVVPQMVAIGATLVTAVTLVAGLTRLRGLIVGCVGGMALLSSLYFIRHGTSQYADTLVGLHMLMALIAACLWVESDDFHQRRRLLVMMGILTGCAIWTKNEGTCFAVLLMGAMVVGTLHRHGRRSWPHLLALAAGLAGFAILAGIVRVAAGAQGDIGSFDVGFNVLIDRATDVERSRELFRGLRAALALTVDWPVILLLLAAGILAAWRRPWREHRAAALLLLVLTAQAGMYAGIYLLTSSNLSWHLQTSADRVLVQLWPSFVLLLCLLLPDLRPPSAVCGKVPDQPQPDQGQSHRPVMPLDKEREAEAADEAGQRKDARVQPLMRR